MPRTRLLEMLRNGDIRLVGATGNGRQGGAHWRGENQILVAKAFFESTDHAYDTWVERSWVLAHELGHLEQVEGKDFNYSHYDGSIASMQDAPETSVVGRKRERDADKFACRHTIDRGAWVDRCH